MSPRDRTVTPRCLPERVQARAGRYYWLRPDGGRRNTWVPIVGADGQPIRYRPRGQHQGGDPCRPLGGLPALLRALAALQEAPVPGSTLAAVFDRYERDVMSGKSAGTQARNRYELANLRTAFGAMRPADLRPVHVAQYVDARAAYLVRQGHKGNSANRERALLHHILGQAVRWGILDRNPADGVSGVAERPRERCPTPEEVAAWCVWVAERTPVLALYTRLAVLTGMSRADLLALRLEQVTAEGIAYTRAKTKRRSPTPVVVEWSPALRAVVDELRGLLGEAAVFGRTPLFRARGGAAYTPSGWSATWKRRMNECVAAGVLAEPFGTHDLRALAASTAQALGQDPTALLGHQHAATTVAYLRSRAPRKVKPTG